MLTGIIAALPQEARCLPEFSRCRRNRANPLPVRSGDLMLMISGSGQERAYHCARILIDRGVGALVSWGCAGALSEHLQPGTLLLPEHIVSASERILYTDAEWRIRTIRGLNGVCRVEHGPLAESPILLTEPQQKHALFVARGCAAVDMESAAVGYAAEQADIPFLCLRAVADTARDRLPPYIPTSIDAHGAINLRHLLWKAALYPRTWPALMRLGHHFHAAMQTLKRAARQSNPPFRYPR